MLNKFNLELNGKWAGQLVRVSDYISGLAHIDIALECGMGMSREFYDWVKTAFSRIFQEKSGAITTSSASESSRLEFSDAVLAGVALPELDKSSKQAATMTVTFKTQHVLHTKSTSPGPARPPSKPWLVSNFRFEIDELEAECKQVVRVSAVSATQKVAQVRTGSGRIGLLMPKAMGLSPLVITLPLADTRGFNQWFEDSLKRNLTTRRGSLEYLAPGGRPYLQLDLLGLGIESITRQGVNTAVKLHCDSMSLSAEASACSG